MRSACLFTLVCLCLDGVLGSKLLKVPRIYNALITSDEELVPSQAYPAVAPVLRPSAPLYLSSEYEQESPIPQPQQPPVNVPVNVETNQWKMLKNNKPSNPDIPDVPPPPLPVNIRSSKT